MCKLYERLAGLCEERGISAYKMCKDIGIQPSIMTDLKYGRRSGVNAITADKIATYFGVSVGYLIGNEQKEKPTVKKDDRHDPIFDKLLNDAEGRELLEKFEKLTSDNRSKLLELIDLYLSAQDKKG